MTRAENKKIAEEMARYLAEERHKERMEHFSHKRLLENTRAGKLLLKDKPFIVVAIDEPYYPQVYRLIRQSEKRKGTWTEQCEKDFQMFMNRWMEG